MSPSINNQRPLQPQSQLMKTFYYSIRSKKTQKQYQLYIKYFESWKEMNGRKIEDLLSLDPKVIEEIVKNYIISMHDKGLSYSTINGHISAINKFLVSHRITINRKWLDQFTGEHNKTVKDKAYSHEDLTKMFAAAPSRTRLIIAIYASTGIRKSALVDLRLKHIQKIESSDSKIYKFTIYENSIKSEYPTFCTPECADMIDKYIETRRKEGEKITEESYLIRNDYDYLSQDKIRNPEPLTANALVSLIDRLITEIGLKKTNYKTQDYKYQRHDKALFHAFRKFFETCLEECNVNAGAIVKLMGWNQDLRSVYNRPAEKILLTEYLKAVNELTINEENRLRKRVEKLEVEKSLIDQLRAEVFIIKQEMAKYKGN